MPEEYVGVRIPKNLAQEVDRLIGKHGFTSRAEIVKEALRQILRTYGLEEGSQDE